jgi:DNA processing protein
MSPAPQAGSSRRACASCLRRSWLVGELSGPLDYRARDRERLLEVLALADADLLRALAGRRAAELRDRYECFRAGPPPPPGHGENCRHRRGYPRGLSDAAAPHMLAVAGGERRLARLTSPPVVAIVGSRTPTDYGIESARTLARGLAASGVTVSACLTDGISVAAHAGVLEAHGASIAVIGGGLGVSRPARRRSLYERIVDGGCAVSELPHGCSGRRWGQLAAERIVVALARLTVLVEADNTAGDLAGAHIARTLGRPLGAIPGRVGSPLSTGPHALLRDGAKLIRGPEDVLELLCSLDGASSSSATGAPSPALAAASPDGALPAQLEDVLSRVGGGCDTPEKLTRTGLHPAIVLPALTELELLGLLARGDGGRYLPRQPLAGHG